MRTAQIKESTWPVIVHCSHAADCDPSPCCGNTQSHVHTFATNVTFVPSEGIRGLRSALYHVSGIPEHMQCVSIICVNRSFTLNRQVFDLQRLVEANQV